MSLGQQGTGLYGVVGQPLTRDYLALQLPIFQQKVPSTPQPKLQFPTNAPANLPLPPMYPGEEIKLQEHRVVCTDTFVEPAVGALYITNYRIIFHGNLISDPESMDALQETNLKVQNKKDLLVDSSSASPLPFVKSSKLKNFNASKGEPSFKSFLTGEQDESTTSQQPSRSHTQRIKSGFKKIGSLRHTPRNFKNKATPPHSLPQDFTDATPPLPEVLNGRDDTEVKIGAKAEGGVTIITPSDVKAKRKDIILNYHQDTVSLDSVSVSSTSEFSATGTDDRSTCSPLGDGESSSSGPVDIVNGERTCLIGGDRIMGFSDVLSCPSYLGDASFEASCGTTGVARASLSSTLKAEVVTGKGSSGAQVLPSTNRKKSVDYEKYLEVLPDSESTGRSEKTSRPSPALEKKAQLVWQNTLVQPESDSDVEDDFLSTKVSRPIVDIGVPSSSILNERVPPETVADVQPAIEVDVNGPPPPRPNGFHEATIDSVEGKEDTSFSQQTNLPDAKVEVTANLHSKKGGGVLRTFKPVARKRSNSSNSPFVKKKPKPLPRASIKKRTANSKEMKNDIFLSSLPANFKPTPLPRLFTSSSRFNAKPSGQDPSSSSKSTDSAKSQQQEEQCRPLPVLSGTTQTSSSHSPLYVSSGTTTNSQESSSPSWHVPTNLQESSAHVSSGPDNSQEVSSNSSDSQQSSTSQQQQVSSTPISPHEMSFRPSSPLHGSSTQSSDTDSSGVYRPANGKDEPVPPPRRKRRSRYKSSMTSKDSFSVLPISPEEPLANSTRDQELGNQSHDKLVSSCDQSHDTSSCDQSHKELISYDKSQDESSCQVDGVPISPKGLPGSVDGTKGQSLNPGPETCKSHDHDGSESCKSPESEEDLLSSPLLEENVDELGLLDTDSHLRHSVADSSRTSRTSLTVLPDSMTSGSSTMRPYSVFSTGEAYLFNFGRSGERSGYEVNTGSYTLPRNSSSWLHGQTSRQSVKTAVAPASTRYSLCVSFPLRFVHSVRKLNSVLLKDHGLKLPDGLLILCRNFHSMRIHVHPHNTYDTDSLKELLENKFLAEKPLYELFAFQYRAAIRHPNPTFLHNRSLPNFFRLPDELIRLGLQDSKLWAVIRVLVNHPELCPSYPSHVIVPICTGDLDYIRGAKQYHEGRFPTLTWYDQCTGVALLRAASTKDDRGHFNSNLQMDEALLRSISGCKLDPSGPPMMVHVFTDKPESGHNERSAEQVRTYYYHNCKFIYATNPPTFRSVRHSFNKLQAMLENKLSDEDYLIALDTTHWLPRVGELLSTAHAICCSLTENRAHVLVCYEAGWDRTTQLVSLAQLLMDPYYRTVDGFQVLVQKEWVWFGHLFQLRHSRAGKSKSKDDGPIFLQWMDCVWQVSHQFPSAFEFNERLLMSMVEHSYSGMFGTFMTNNEAARKQCFMEKGYEHKSVSSHTVSFWTWVNMINAAGRTFYNDLYDPNMYKSIIEPRSTVPCLKLWSSHYCRYKPEENVHQSTFIELQLEELLRTYKKLETSYAELVPSEQTSQAKDENFPPPLPSREELQFAYKSSNEGKAKPIPPPKPVASKHKYESLEEFLVQEGFDTSICKHLELGSTTCQGNLYKLGAVRKNWLQRWFVLDFNCQYLAYFENQLAYSNRVSPKGVIRLSDISRVFQEVKRKDHLMKNIFMVETPRRTYQMQAPTITTMYIWIACLELPVSSLKLGAI